MYAPKLGIELTFLYVQKDTSSAEFTECQRIAPEIAYRVGRSTRGQSSNTCGVTFTMVESPLLDFKRY